MTDSVLAPAIREEVERLERADIVIGVTSGREPEALRHVARAAHVGLAQAFPDLRSVVVLTGDADAVAGLVETDLAAYVEDVLLARPLKPARHLGGPGVTQRGVLEVAAALDARATVLLDGRVHSALPEWVELLAGPILRGRFDVVAPRYRRHRYDAPITNLLAYPLLRALSGRRLREPMAADLGLGRDAVRRLLDATSEPAEPAEREAGPWLAGEAVAAGLTVGEARLGPKAAVPRGQADAATTFLAVGDGVLALAARHVEHRQPAAESPDLPCYGFERTGDPPAVRVDPVRLLTDFESAAADRESWAGFLGPATLNGVRSLAVTAAGVVLAARDWLNLDRGADVTRLDTATLAGAMATFAFPDDLWARVVFDAVVAARPGEQARRDIAAALWPLFAARVASFVAEARTATPDDAEALVERQALAFERLAPGLARRWVGTAAAPGAGR